MTFRDILAQVINWLQQDKRVSYRALKRQFALDDAYLEDLKDSLLFAYPVVDEDGRGLVWTGSPATPMANTINRDGSQFHASLPVVIALLRQEKRATYRTLKDAFNLDDAVLEGV